MPKRSLTPGSLPDRQAVAHHLVVMREALGYTKAEMADAIGCDRRDWGRYENATRDLPLAKAWAIHRRFDFTLNFTYDGSLSGVPADLRDEVVRRLNVRPDREAS